MASRSVMRVEPDVGITDLIRRLSDDSKRLVSDEVRLAKLEVREGVRLGAKGTLWLAVAFGVAVVALVAFTVFLAALIGRLANHHYWLGAIVTGLLELGLALWLVKRGLHAFAEPSYTLAETRAEAERTVGALTNGKG